MILLLLLCSCNDQKIPIKDNSIIGYWYEMAGTLGYHEHYIDAENMYDYNSWAGDYRSYRYYIRNDSIFRYFIHPEEPPKHRFYDRIIATYSDSIQLENTMLRKMKDTNVTLEMLIKDKIDKKVYDSVCSSRKMNKTYRWHCEDVISEYVKKKYSNTSIGSDNGELILHEIYPSKINDSANIEKGIFLNPKYNEIIVYDKGTFHYYTANQDTIKVLSSFKID